MDNIEETEQVSSSSSSSTGVRSADELKELGNIAFGNKKYNEAIQFYTDAIKRDTKNHVYYSNRSASYAGLATEATAASIDTSNKKDKTTTNNTTTNTDNNNNNNNTTTNTIKYYWTMAISDAKECIRLDPSFVKGYYRLATAQIEIKDYDTATATIRQGLLIENNNLQLTKLLRIVQQQQKVMAARQKQKQAQQLQQQQQSQVSAAAASTSTSTLGAGGPLSSTTSTTAGFDPATVKELQELQTSYQLANRELGTVQANLLKSQREYKLAELTKLEIIGTPANSGTTTNTNTDPTAEPNIPTTTSSTNSTIDTTSTTTNKYYRSIGKMFILQQSKQHVEQHLNKRLESYQREEETLQQKVQYLQNKILSYRQNMEELLSTQQQQQQHHQQLITQ